ncbi:conserved hypothetical protein [Clavispora lusitaniae ATCC 42720]|uniref:Uncharacterized protein n=1 Tax=Clavispora lusitaniae (strain ATCC 42720) TaxID=306902 RepID=C4Y1S8_CLAL4|nr:uncharacterized protein CLUG_02160 [Clavispora lusitaniae ATCC 42720]EEQ38038.1 conserved hypothetical protein [Clavispora lusitaniae ATCC 42720]KAF5211665.1 hypothetical protein E0198_001205 [Clavispora lusitaniae]
MENDIQDRGVFELDVESCRTQILNLVEFRSSPNGYTEAVGVRSRLLFLFVVFFPLSSSFSSFSSSFPSLPFCRLFIRRRCYYSTSIRSTVYFYSQSTAHSLSVSFNDVTVLQVQIFRSVVWRHTGAVNQESQRFHRLPSSLAKGLHQSLHGRCFFDFEKNLGGAIADFQVDVRIVGLFFLWLFGHWYGVKFREVVLAWAFVYLCMQAAGWTTFA